MGARYGGNACVQELPGTDHGHQVMLGQERNFTPVAQARAAMLGWRRQWPPSISRQMN
jgi:hypothetical protein